jgi:hypothetical protein
LLRARQTTSSSGISPRASLFRFDAFFHLLVSSPPQNLMGHNSIINTMCVNGDGVMMSGGVLPVTCVLACSLSAGDNGSMCMWDYRTGYQFQNFMSLPQPGVSCVCALAMQQPLRRVSRQRGWHPVLHI